MYTTAGAGAEGRPLPLPYVPTAVLLDLDGTLVDSAPAILMALRAAFSELGLPAQAPAELMRFVGPPLVDGFRLYAGLTGAANAEAVATYRRHYRETMLDSPLYDGAAELVRGLHAAGMPLALATSKHEGYAREILAHKGLADCFTVVSGARAGDVSGRKAAVIHSALQRLAAAGADLDRPVHVGDLDHDVQGARAEGVDCIGALWGYGSAEELRGAIALVTTPAELGALLGVEV
ncbi:phosphoglycolate phosphatase [Actinomyces ruminicola]|uniref:Phosphoglycolate phosphatase n=1 Tax=Actinomyces ruminicola TaxID=332524 RepID=A0A1H0D7A1_9ACTO|nr:HAD hydrolase-like protein [Actinomyces ruminicola]SDN65939.1 phosphoglycolate phosphatase [Actinomyces ruminicola]